MFGSKKTVDGVMASLNQNIRDLEAVQVEQQEREKALRVQAEELTNNANLAAEEASRAASVAGKIKALLS